jgi:hypothetical protein
MRRVRKWVRRVRKRVWRVHRVDYAGAGCVGNECISFYLSFYLSFFFLSIYLIYLFIYFSFNGRRWGLRRSGSEGTRVQRWWVSLARDGM